MSVICPQGPGDPKRHDVDGVALYKYAPAPEAEGLAGFAYEFAYSWIRTALLSLAVRREKGFDVIQACNPPDTYWLLGLLWKTRGVRFVFDHHDLNPELFLSRFGAPTTPLQHAELTVLRWLERCTFRTADHVISTNESFKKIAMERGGVAEEDVTVVRSGPDTRSMYPTRPDPEVRGDGSHLLAYLGIMGPQDGVESVLHLMEELVHARGRTSVRAVLLGFGDSLESLRDQCTQLGLDDYVTFTGRVGPTEIAKYLSAADVGLGPDPATPMNDLSTMNKTMEYMAFGLPSVAFDLKETRISGENSVLYVPPGDIGAFADAVERLLDDDELRAEMAVSGRRRAVSVLDWRPQRTAYLQAIQSVVSKRSLGTGEPAGEEVANELGVPTDDQSALATEEELRSAVRRRGFAGA